ncbi:MAG: hypothetical protein ABI367_13090 [Mucilaginibacter sp.]
MYFRGIFLFFFCSCITFCAGAQQLFTVSGTIYKKSYNERVAQVSITNTGRKTATTSNDQGVFHIQAAKGDTLLFKKDEFTTQFFVIFGEYDINIYMLPVIALKEVTIREQSRKQELNDALGQYRKQGSFYNGKPTALSFLSSPLTGMYELFGKGPKQARHFKQYSKDELEQLEINKKYNSAIVKQITNMPDEDIESFMHTFTPSYEEVKGWNDYDVINYIKKSYEYFQANKAQLKVEKLY